MWNKIWKIISDYLIDIIINYPKENISRQAFDSLNNNNKYLEKKII